MLILMQKTASDADVAAVCDRIRELGFTPHQIPGSQRVAIGITGNEGPLEPELFTAYAGVAEAVAVSRPWKLVSREVKPEDTSIRLDTAKGASADIGGGAFGVIAGPCAVESHDQLMTTARAVKAAGARF